MHKRGPAFWVLASLGALLALFFVVRVTQTLYHRLAPSQEQEVQARVVNVLRLEPQLFEHTVPIAGTLAPVNSAMVFPKVEGKVVRLHVKLGDVVRAGQPLATVEAIEWGLQASQADVGLEMADKAAALARKTLERLDAVHERLGEGALSQQDYEEARVQAEGALTQAELARYQRDLVRQMVKNATMTAPIAGQVSQVYARLGNMVGHEYPAFQVDDISRLVLRCQVADLQLPRVAVGQQVRLRTDTLPDLELVGEVEAVSPTLDAITRRAPVEIGLPNPKGQVIGNVFARGEIVVGRDERALVVPLVAVERSQGGAQVQLVRDGRVVNVPVEVLGESDDALSLGGVAPGDLLILPGSEHLAPGEAVEVHLLEDGRGAPPTDASPTDGASAQGGRHVAE